MFLSNAGSLGIGTTSPSYKFDVYGTDDVTMRIHRPSSGLAATDTCGIGFSQRGDANTSTTDTRAGIFSTYNGDLFLAVEAGGNLNSNPMDHSALFIEGTNANVGLGTTSPTSALHVTSTAANTNGMVRFQNNMDNNYETLRIESLGNYDAHIGFFADGDANHYWGAGVDYTDGNFKIANDNLLATNTKFVVQSNGYLVAQSASNIRLVLGSTGNPDNNTSNWIRGNSGYLQYNCANLGHTWEITGSEKMRINSNGRVGIGETSPGAQLHVHSGASSDIVKFANNNGSFIFGKTANLGSLDMASDANFRIRHGSTVSATFTSSGDIGVGTTSPSAKVHSYASSTNAQAFHAQGLGSNNFKIVPYCSNGAFSSLTSEDDVCLVAENAGAIVLGHHASGYYGMRIQSTGSC